MTPLTWITLDDGETQAETPLGLACCWQARGGNFCAAFEPHGYASNRFVTMVEAQDWIRRVVLAQTRA